MSIETKLREIISHSCDKLTRELSIRFIMLIGSQATGQISHMSDIDIAVYVDPLKFDITEITLEIKFELFAILSEELERDDIDIVILNNANPVIRFNCIKNGYNAV